MPLNHAKESDTPMTIGAAAQRFGVSRDTLRRWADAGKIPVIVTPGGQRRFRPSDLEHVLTPAKAAS